MANGTDLCNVILRTLAIGTGFFTIVYYFMDFVVEHYLFGTNEKSLLLPCLQYLLQLIISIELIYATVKRKYKLMLPWLIYNAFLCVHMAFTVIVNMCGNLACEHSTAPLFKTETTMFWIFYKLASIAILTFSGIIIIIYFYKCRDTARTFYERVIPKINNNHKIYVVRKNNKMNLIQKPLPDRALTQLNGQLHKSYPQPTTINNIYTTLPRKENKAEICHV